MEKVSHILESAWGTGIITGFDSNTFAVDKHFNSGVKGPAGFTKLVELMPHKTIQCQQDCATMYPMATVQDESVSS